MKATTTLYLAGNPNCGKTSLFNLLAGLNQKVSNIPGTTVEKVEGKVQLGGETYNLIDLPGAYSLYPKSEDELVASNALLSDPHARLIFVADATRLEANLYYYTQLADLGLPTVLVLNMVDLAEDKGVVIDYDGLSADLGVLVVPISARQNKGIETLKASILKTTQVSQNLPFFNTYDAGLSVSQKIALFRDQTQAQLDLYVQKGNTDAAQRKTDMMSRQHWVKELVSKHVTYRQVEKRLIEKIDHLFLHPVYGMLFLFGVLFLIFQSVFSLAEWPMQGIEWLFVQAGSVLREWLPEGFWSDLITEGVVGGLAGIVVFLPQILLLFFFIGLLEETGYITRVSFLTDRFMRTFGLNGKSVIPLAGGLACAIPSIMAARTIENKAEKLATILVTPLMTCSARLPVYTLLISLLVPEDSQVWIFNTRGLVLMGMYLLGFVAALLLSLLFSLFLNFQKRDIFLLEVPDLRPPRWGALFFTLYRKGMTFLLGAGKVILIVSIVLFFLKSYGPGDKREAIRAHYAATHGSELTDELALQQEAELLEASWIGSIGKVIEPVIRPMGYDWKIGIALLTSFAAREVFVGTMSAIYGVAEDEEGLGLRERIQAQKNPETGDPVYTLPVVISLLIFYAFSLQCMSTVAIVYKETNSAKWPFLQLFSMTGLAYILSTLCYQLLS